MDEHDPKPPSIATKYCSVVSHGVVQLETATITLAVCVTKSDRALTRLSRKQFGRIMLLLCNQPGWQAYTSAVLIETALVHVQQYSAFLTCCYKLYSLNITHHQALASSKHKLAGCCRLRSAASMLSQPRHCCTVWCTLLNQALLNITALFITGTQPRTWTKCNGASNYQLWLLRILQLHCHTP